MEVAIIGGGATGLLLASQLVDHFNVTLYVRRQEQEDAIKENGLLLYDHDNRTQISGFTVQHISTLKNADYVFVCVKQTQLDRLLPKLKLLDERVQLIFLQNGMGHVESISSLQQQIFVGVIEHGAKRIDDHVVHFLGKGKIRIAPFQATKEQLDEFIMTFTKKHFPFKAEMCWQTMLAQKLIVNAVINPLTAIFNVDNGKVIANEHLCHLARQLCNEAAQSLQLDSTTEWERVKQTVQTTANNTSSMRSDILANRKTEIDAISGYLLRHAKGRNLPYTSFVYESILALEEERDRYDS
ncbi:MAG TPA: 2-dehydropantoate 2-reductase [Pseudogracilibacillus sp.]|nr:2-dehydropantoate 2-reductase [Pseudogracilibacillus sp.]